MGHRVIAFHRVICSSATSRLFSWVMMMDLRITLSIPLSEHIHFKPILLTLNVILADKNGTKISPLATLNVSSASTGNTVNFLPRK